MDLDGDGNIDILSGSWPGELYMFQGMGKGRFGRGVPLKDKNGKVIKVASASTVFAVDFRGKGVLDLLVGSIEGHVYLIPNEGTAKKYAFGKAHKLQAGGQEIRVNHGDSHPVAADWDGDGKLDLIVGAGDGSVLFYRNIGSKAEPKFAAAKTLVPAGKFTYGENAPKEPGYGTRAKVCVVDWNGDGKLDLLVGDFSSYQLDKSKITDAEKKAIDEARKKLPALQKAYQEIYQKEYVPASRIFEKPEVAKERLAKLKIVQNKMLKALKAVQDCQAGIVKFEGLAWERMPQEIRKAEQAAREKLAQVNKAYREFLNKEYYPLTRVPKDETEEDKKARMEKMRLLQAKVQVYYQRLQAAQTAHQKLGKPDMSKLTDEEKEARAAANQKLAELNKVYQDIVNKEYYPLSRPIEDPEARKVREAKMKPVLEKLQKASKAMQEYQMLVYKYQQSQYTGSVWLFLREGPEGRKATR